MLYDGLDYLKHLVVRTLNCTLSYLRRALMIPREYYLFVLFFDAFRRPLKLLSSLLDDRLQITFPSKSFALFAEGKFCYSNLKSPNISEKIESVFE